MPANRRPVIMWAPTYIGGKGWNDMYVRKTRKQVKEAMGDWDWYGRMGVKLVKVHVSLPPHKEGHE